MGPGRTSTVHWCLVRREGCGWPDTSTTHKKSTVHSNTSNHFLYFRAIQGHSGDNAIDHALQDNVLLPKGCTEHTYHVGNASELNSIIRNGLIPGGKRIKRGRQAVFCTTVNLTCSRSLQHTTCSLHGEAACVKTQEELHQKVRLTPRVPRVVLKSNSQCGLQDPHSHDATSSWEPSKRFEKLRGNL